MTGKPDVRPNFVAAAYTRETRWETLQRRLIFSFLDSIAQSLPKGPLLDVGSFSPALGKRLGGDPVHTLDVQGLSTYRIDADADWSTLIPSDYYAAVVSTNFLLLAQKPEKVAENIYRCLRPGGLAVLDFASLTFWYQGGDGTHHHAYNPTLIQAIMKPFAHVVIHPIGNFFQAAVNHYAKICPQKYISLAIARAGAVLGRFDRNPTSAISYVAVARK